MFITLYFDKLFTSSLWTWIIIIW